MLAYLLLLHLPHYSARVIDHLHLNIWRSMEGGALSFMDSPPESPGFAEA